MMNHRELLQRTYDHARETSMLAGTLALLEWDQHTYIPSRAGAFRADQITCLSGILHERQTSPTYGDWLATLAESDFAKDRESIDAANIRGLLRDFKRNIQLPESLVKATAHATSIGQQIWAEARANDDFISFLPALETIINLRREEASILQKPDRTKYDSLLDQYEEGADSEHIANVFDSLRRELVPIVQQASEKERISSRKIVAGSVFEIDAQRRLARWVAQQIGFDFDRGRLDDTEHPFCTTLGPHDHRILSRYFPDSYSSGLYGVLHEAGHGMYEQGTPTDMHGLPAGSAASLGIHESQSRLWENVVGRSRGFWRWLLPHAYQHLPPLRDFSLERIREDLNRVEPSLIRIESDEATYNLHIFVRFEIEKDLIDGDLKTSDLPDLWNQRYREYLGVTPLNHATGLMQDVHWSAGLIGYFPTYTLGNLYAAQIMQAAENQLGDMEELFSRGEFFPLLEWLRVHIHSRGRCIQPHELMRQVTGKPLEADSFLNYLKSKLL